MTVLEVKRIGATTMVPQDLQITHMRPQQEYFEHLKAGRFMLQRSRSTGIFVFYPRVAVPRTGETDLEWVPASGCGVVYATTVIRPRPPQAPYNVAVIELAEGPRMMSRVEGVPPQDVRIGMAVRARVAEEDGQALVVFDPATGHGEQA